MHKNEIIFSQLTEEQQNEARAEAERLGPGHVKVLDQQIARQKRLGV
ncbi:MAG: hypothetical protein KY428_07305 [Bacteroidetes bacterium]|nr:hypothetical protein [Bacteroidota bacterium]